MPSNVQLGRAYVVAGLDTTALAQGLRQMQVLLRDAGGQIAGAMHGALRGVGIGLDAARGGLRAIGDTISGVGGKMISLAREAMAPIENMARAGAAQMDRIAKMSTRLGVATEWLSETAYAASLAGVEMETLTSAITRMSVAIEAGATGRGKMAEVFRAIGVDARALAAANTAEQFDTLAAAIRDVADQGVRMTAVRAIFGRGTESLLQFFPTDMSAGRTEARRLGVSILAETARAAERLQDMYTRLGAAINGIGNSIASALMPYLERVNLYFANFAANVGDYLRRNPEIVRGIYEWAKALLAVGGSLVGIGTAISALSVLASPGGIIFGVIAATVVWSGAIDDLAASWRDAVMQFEIGGRAVGEWLGLFREGMANVARAVADLWPTISEMVGNIFHGIFAMLRNFGAQIRIWLMQLLKNIITELLPAIREAMSQNIVGRQFIPVLNVLAGNLQTSLTKAIRAAKVDAAMAKITGGNIGVELREGAEKLATGAGKILGAFREGIGSPAMELFKNFVGEKRRGTGDIMDVFRGLGETFPTMGAGPAPMFRTMVDDIVEAGETAARVVSDYVSAGGFSARAMGAMSSRDPFTIKIDKQIEEQKKTNRILSEIADRSIFPVYG